MSREDVQDIYDPTLSGDSIPKDSFVLVHERPEQTMEEEWLKELWGRYEIPENEDMRTEDGKVDVAGWSEEGFLFLRIADVPLKNVS